MRAWSIISTTVALEATQGKAAYPVEGVGKGVFTEIGEHFVINFESSEIC